MGGDDGDKGLSSLFQIRPLPNPSFHKKVRSPARGRKNKGGRDRERFGGSLFAPQKNGPSQSTARVRGTIGVDKCKPCSCMSDGGTPNAAVSAYVLNVCNVSIFRHGVLIFTIRPPDNCHMRSRGIHMYAAVQ